MDTNIDVLAYVCARPCVRVFSWKFLSRWNWAVRLTDGRKLMTFFWPLCWPRGRPFSIVGDFGGDISCLKRVFSLRRSCYVARMTSLLVNIPILKDILVRLRVWFVYPCIPVTMSSLPGHNFSSILFPPSVFSLLWACLGSVFGLQLFSTTNFFCFGQMRSLNHR